MGPVAGGAIAFGGVQAWRRAYGGSGRARRPLLRQNGPFSPLSGGFECRTGTLLRMTNEALDVAGDGGEGDLEMGSDGSSVA